MMSFWLTVISSLAVLSVSSGPESSARIDVEVTEDAYVITAIAHAQTSASGTYTLVVEKTGSSGRSRSQQSGAFDLEGGRHHTLSTSTVGVRPGDVVRVDLEVEWEDGTRTEDTFEETVRSR